MSQEADHLAADAPLLWLRDKLHAGTTLEERVRALRWKRKRPQTASGFVNDAGEQPACLVCGGPEPCSHDFDQQGRELEEIGKRMGSKQLTNNDEKGQADD